MGKISQVSAKYLVHASIQIEGVVDKPDIIGAVFGQTEGLLGNDLELRELQRNGRIGRIEVTTESRAGKTQGTILVPSSLDKAETCIVAAALEIIQRIGPCNAKIVVQKIEDVRVSKRDQVVLRAKELLKTLVDSVMPDSAEFADEVSYSVRVEEITTYGKDKLPAGPNLDEAEEIIIVEGRADVVNLLKYGFKNVIALNGTSVPDTIAKLSKEKSVTVFVDGDRGGNLIIRGLADVAEVDFVTRAPDGKEVEELAKKEINKALRSKITWEQALLDLKSGASDTKRRPSAPAARNDRNSRNDRNTRDRNTRTPRNDGSANERPERRERAPPRKAMSDSEKKTFKKMGGEMIGSRGASLVDADLKVLGKVPVTGLANTIKSLDNVHAVVFDGEVDKDIAGAADKAGVKYLIGMDSKVKQSETKAKLMNIADL